MKQALRYSLLILFMILFCAGNARSQVIEVLDKVSSLLIPSISTSVKEIIEARGRSNQKEEAKQEVDAKIKAAQQLLVRDLDKELANLAVIREVFTLTRKMNSAIGGLALLTDRTLLPHLVGSDATELKKRISLTYALYYREIQDNYATLKSMDVSNLDPNLLLELAKNKEAIERAINRINGINGFTANPTLDSTSISQIQNNIVAIDLSARDIAAIQQAVENIALIIDTRLKTYELTFAQWKNSVR